MKLNNIVNKILTEDFHKDVTVDNASKSLIKLLKSTPVPNDRYQSLIFTILNSFNHIKNDIDASWNLLENIAKNILRGEKFALNSQVLDALLDKEKFNDEEHKYDKDEITFNNWTINKRARILTINNVIYKLPNQQFELLYLLMTNANHFLDREYILNRVWGESSYQIENDRLIDVKLSQLRKIIVQKNPKLQSKIKSIIQSRKNIGYAFIPPN